MGSLCPKQPESLKSKLMTNCGYYNGLWVLEYSFCLPSYGFSFLMASLYWNACMFAKLGFGINHPCFFWPLVESQVAEKVPGILGTSLIFKGSQPLSHRVSGHICIAVVSGFHGCLFCRSFVPDPGNGGKTSGLLPGSDTFPASSLTKNSISSNW